MIEIIAIFFAGFFNVFLLGINSQFVRDQHYVMVFIVSWFISVAQFTQIHVIANIGDTGVAAIFFSSGLGSSLGIVSSIFFYRWFNPILHNYLKKRDKYDN